MQSRVWNLGSCFQATSLFDKAEAVRQRLHPMTKDHLEYARSLGRHKRRQMLWRDMYQVHHAERQRYLLGIEYVGEEPQRLHSLALLCLEKPLPMLQEQDPLHPIDTGRLFRQMHPQSPLLNCECSSHSYQQVGQQSLMQPLPSCLLQLQGLWIWNMDSLHLLCNHQ